MPKTNNTAYIILGLLSHENLSGYDIKKRIDSMISYFWEIGFGQIYPTLKALEEEGAVIKGPGEAGKGPERNIYSITEKGKTILQEWLILPEAKEYTRYEILLKLYFGNMVSLDENIQRIEMFKERHQKNLEMMGFFKTNLEQVLDNDKDHLYYYLTVLFGEEVYKGYIRWAEKAAEMLDSTKKRQS